MNPEDWERVKQIVDACLELDPPARASHLAAACATNPALRSEVESLLAAYEDADDFMDASALEANPQTLIGGQRIGNYELRELIAEGGMGTVYRAVRTSDFQKQVAIKLVKRGMDTDFILRRFHNERQILAGLDHPHIARLFDGGAAEDGRPYLVMEFVEGVPITGYCEQQKLSIPARLDLFRTVCSAVQYAHQNLIVHRDLKPGNILVAADGTPKLLDFGIAKLLEPQPDLTITSMRMMTPECASPEQVRGQPVTTASDIYALGVLLYQLLVGERPYRITSRTPEEITRLVCETDPARPSALRKSLSADLDNIVLKAMHKEPQRRYVSVEQLSEDIRRYLTGLPVMARKDTFSYRTSKFLRRHKTASLAAALLALSLIAGMAATLWQARIANAQRARAERRFQDVRKLANALIFKVHDSIQNLPGSTPARKLIVQEALQYLDSLAQESAGDRSLQRELASAYEKIGDVQGGFRSASMGDLAGALKSYRKALAIRESVAAADSKDADLGRELARNHGKISDLLLAEGDSAGALQHCGQVVSIASSLTAQDPRNNADRRLLAAAYGDCGYKRAESGEWKKGVESCRKAVAMMEEFLASDPADPRLRHILAVSYSRLGQLLAEDAANYSEALAMQEKVVSTVDPVLSKESMNTDFRRIKAWAFLDAGQLLAQHGNPSGALEYDRKALTELEPLSASDQQNVQFRVDLAYALVGLGDVSTQLGHLAASREHLHRALAILEAVPSSNQANRDTQVALALNLFSLGNLYSRLASGAAGPAAQARYWQQAKSWYQRSVPALTFAKEHHSLTGTDAMLADKAVQSLARCDQVLARLQPK